MLTILPQGWDGHGRKLLEATEYSDWTEVLVEGLWVTVLAHDLLRRLLDHHCDLLGHPLALFGSSCSLSMSHLQIYFYFMTTKV